MRTLALLVPVVLAAAVGWSCRRSVAEPAETTSDVGLRIEGPSTLEPGLLPYSKGALILAGQTYPVDVVRETNKDRVYFTLLNHGEVLDREVYVHNDDSFSLASGGGVTYDPPIPLLVYGSRVGGTLTWGGRVVDGPDRSDAKAVVTSEQASLNLAGGFFEGVGVHVDLEIAMPQGPVGKRLSFWFVPKRGIIKREFGATSTRVPVGE